jgi:hypothetical protein
MPVLEVRDLADQAAALLRSAMLTSRPDPLADAAWQAHITLVRVANRAVDGLTHLDITAALSTLDETIHSCPAPPRAVLVSPGPPSPALAGLTSRSDTPPWALCRSRTNPPKSGSALRSWGELARSPVFLSAGHWCSPDACRSRVARSQWIARRSADRGRGQRR